MDEHYVTAMTWGEGGALLACRCGWIDDFEYWESHRSTIGRSDAT